MASLLSLGASAGVSPDSHSGSDGYNPSGTDRPPYTSVPFTLADREKLIRIEQRLDYMEKRIDHLEKPIDRLEAEVADLRKEMRSYFLTTLIVLVSLIRVIGVVFGYLLYERNKQIDHEYRLQKLVAAWYAPPSS